MRSLNFVVGSLCMYCRALSQSSYQTLLSLICRLRPPHYLTDPGPVLHLASSSTWRFQPHVRQSFGGGVWIAAFLFLVPADNFNSLGP
jgi:hypothetical protein